MNAERGPQIIDHWLKSLGEEKRPHEGEVKKLLQAYGIDVPRGIFLPWDVPFSMTVVSERGITPPYAVKVCSAEILHKTEHGGVILEVDSDSLASAVAGIKKQFPGSGVLVETMVSFSSGEFIVGGMMDPVFGPAVMVGAGGILTELFKDVTFRLAPCSKEETHRMLKELTVYPLLDGYRGSVIDPDRFAAIISSVGDLIAHLGAEFSQLDINPIVYSNGKWVALDAMIVLT